MEKQPLSYSGGKNNKKKYESMLENHCFPSPPTSALRDTLKFCNTSKEELKSVSGRRLGKSEISLTIIVLSIKKCKLHHLLSKSNRSGIRSWYSKVTNSVVAD